MRVSFGLEGQKKRKKKTNVDESVGGHPNANEGAMRAEVLESLLISLSSGSDDDRGVSSHAAGEGLDLFDDVSKTLGETVSNEC
jgi:hypothetical protein